MKFAVLVLATLIGAVICSEETRTCEKDVIFAIDLSQSMTDAEFDKSKEFMIKVYENLNKDENSMKFGVIAYGDNAAHGLVTLSQGSQDNVVEREINQLVTSGNRPSLVKALKLVRTYLKPGNGERPTVEKTVVAFITAEPSNIIGCLKYASQVRRNGVNIVAVVLSSKEQEVADSPGTQHSSPNTVMRDLITFLSTVVGSPENVHVLYIYEENFFNHAVDIADTVCPPAVAVEEEPAVAVEEEPVVAVEEEPVVAVEEEPVVVVEEEPVVAVEEEPVDVVEEEPVVVFKEPIVAVEEEPVDVVEEIEGALPADIDVTSVGGGSEEPDQVEYAEEAVVVEPEEVVVSKEEQRSFYVEDTPAYHLPEIKRKYQLPEVGAKNTQKSSNNYYENQAYSDNQENAQDDGYYYYEKQEPQYVEERREAVYVADGRGQEKLAQDRSHHNDDQQRPYDMLNQHLRILARRTSTTTSKPTTTTLSEQDLKAIAFCEEVLSNADVEMEQFFGNPDDCTSFYQCSLETGVLLAKLFACQPGMFWKEQLKQCMPGTGCMDRCEEPAIAKKGVYADPKNCRRWFQCANGISYPACCPVETAYDEVLQTCVTDELCDDYCETNDDASKEKPKELTTSKPRYDANGCYDRWGAFKRPNHRNLGKYYAHIGKGHFVITSCPAGTYFDLIECDCLAGDPADFGLHVDYDLYSEEEQEEEIHCWLYFPFDLNLNDYSNHRLWVTPVVFGGAWVDGRVYIQGSGSARISSSGIAIPGLGGADFRDHMTMAMWVKCYSSSTPCYGDLFANGNNKIMSTIRVTLVPTEYDTDRDGKLEKLITVEFALVVMTVDEPVVVSYTLPRPSSLAHWTHFAMRYDGFALTLCINGTIVHEVAASGNVGVSMTQIVVGGAVTSKEQFRGYLDEIIVLPVALDNYGMENLRFANMAQLANDGWIKV